jgi:hypothetical protein
MANLKDAGNQTGLPEPKGRILMGRSNKEGYSAGGIEVQGYYG